MRSSSLPNSKFWPCYNTKSTISQEELAQSLPFPVPLTGQPICLTFPASTTEFSTKCSPWTLFPVSTQTFCDVEEFDTTWWFNFLWKKNDKCWVKYTLYLIDVEKTSLLIQYTVKYKPNMNGILRLWMRLGILELNSDLSKFERTMYT